MPKIDCLDALHSLHPKVEWARLHISHMNNMNQEQDTLERQYIQYTSTELEQSPLKQRATFEKRKEKCVKTHYYNLAGGTPCVYKRAF